MQIKPILSNALNLIFFISLCIACQDNIAHAGDSPPSTCTTTPEERAADAAVCAATELKRQLDNIVEQNTFKIGLIRKKREMLRTERDNLKRYIDEVTEGASEMNMGRAFVGAVTAVVDAVSIKGLLGEFRALRECRTTCQILRQQGSPEYTLKALREQISDLENITIMGSSLIPVGPTIRFCTEIANSCTSATTGDEDPMPFWTYIPVWGGVQQAGTAVAEILSAQEVLDKLYPVLNNFDDQIALYNQLIIKRKREVYDAALKLANYICNSPYLGEYSALYNLSLSFDDDHYSICMDELNEFDLSKE